MELNTVCSRRGTCRTADDCIAGRAGKLVPMRRALRILAVFVVLAFLYPATVLGLYFFTSDHNADLTTVDTLIVLGTPTLPDGSPSPEQRERVMEGVREIKRGVSSRVIMTGGPAHNHFVEAATMA